ncbi:pregnancy-specific glycoprotein 22-like isoform X3 [Peromyscus maniculatus bairdii]|uniref:pregnancy-specific glycoprotein 22-like isoform X3 n=1 Tax=Peromyscus maniculatus bairdii TaxID=230844 RepID=UPI003FD334D6
MEVSSMFPCKGCTPWQGLLFTASILTCWHLSTTDHFGVEVVPPYVANGDSVLFLVRNLPKNLLSFAWIKGGTSMNDAIIVYIPNNNLSVPGRFHSGRETVYGNGSLLIQNVNQNDTGVYSLRAFNRRTDTVSQIGTYLYVNNILWTCGRLTPSPRPTVESVPPSVPHGGNVFLRVRNLPENMVGFIWYKWMNTFTRVEVGRYMVDKKTTQLGPAYTGRETWYSDGTLLLRSVTQEELYLIQIQRKFLETEEILVKVQVDESVTQPFVRITDTVIAGQRSVTFSCISRDTDISIRWIFNNQNLKLTESMTLSPTKCGLRIDSATRENAGEYKCQVSNRFSSKTSPPVFWP